MIEGLEKRREGRRGGRRRDRGDAPARKVDYRSLRHPFPAVPVFSEDRVEAIHDMALRTLEDLGIKILLPEARALFRKAGALVDDETQMVRIGREIVTSALASAPRQFTIRAGAAHRDVQLELGHLTIQSGAGCPNVTDLVGGRRPGSLADFEDLVQLIQSYDVLHMVGPATEPQDVDPAVRHYATMRTILRRSDKVPFVYSRGPVQVADAFEMLRIGRDLSKDAFEAEPRCYTIINTNSPRQIDIPMAQGLIDFARSRQVSVVTPFCLMGAMAPVSIAGALVLSHAEALAGIALTQIARPGAPVCYGAFVSNVDLKSGAPAFGTPEQVKANLAAGQLARKLGLPWRCAAGCAANINDAQAAHETQMSAWGAMLAGCTILVHGAGWIEGGLTLSFEKLITDLETMQVFAELCAPTPVDDAELAFDALQEVAPGGHFFAAAHTMERYQTAFYEPLVADWSNFGTWTERGAKDANARATEIWKSRLAKPVESHLPEDRSAALDRFIATRTAEGGAPPVS
ncbi:MAG: trimethylamine methyltransferase family protein [Pseudomonadota bacterium]